MSYTHGLLYNIVCPSAVATATVPGDESCGEMIRLEQELRQGILGSAELDAEESNQFVSELSSEDLSTFLETVEAHLGLKHWLAMVLWHEMYRREMEQANEVNFTAAHCSLQILEWVIGRGLEVPPLPLVNLFARMALRTLEFLKDKVGLTGKNSTKPTGKK